MKNKHIAVFISAISLFQIIKFNKEKLKAEHRLQKYQATSTQLEYGTITYLDNRLNNEIILSSHGLFGGYDQAYENLRNLKYKYRIIAPSRFGYPGSDVLGKGTPKEQSYAFKLLLDHLKINKVFILGASAGGTPTIRFALDYPEYVKGVILFSSASPINSPVSHVPKRMGPPKILINDVMMWLLSPFFNKFMGMSPETIHEMMPIKERKMGVELDITVTNPDMIKHFEQYPVESIKSPVLIVHAKDDKLADFEQVKSSMHRYPNLKACIFKTGGHLMIGHEEESEQAVIDFINRNK